MNFFSDNENFERGPPRHAGGNGNQGINFVWPNRRSATFENILKRVFFFRDVYFMHFDYIA